MDVKEELQPFLKLLAALIFCVAGIMGLVNRRVMTGRYGVIWFEGVPAIIVALVVLLVGLGILLSWIKDRGWLAR